VPPDLRDHTQVRKAGEVTTPFENVINQLTQRRCDPAKNGNGWKALCPAHDDQKPSLSVSESDDGKVLICCHVGCTNQAIVDSMGLKLADLFPPKPNSTHKATGKKGGKPQQGFDTLRSAIDWMAKKMGATASIGCDYNPSFHIHRFDKPDGSKEFKPFRHGNDGWRIQDPPGKLPLYHLSELAAPAIWVFEGEKCVDRARALGMVATTSSHGSQSARKSDWSPLAGKAVFIVPDNDQAGEKYADDVGGELFKLEPKPITKVVHLPLTNKGDDIAEWLDDVVPDTWGPDECRVELERLAAAAAVWVPPAKPTDDRPEITISTDEMEVNTQAIIALAKDPELYRLGYVLATIHQDPEPTRGISRPDGPAPQIVPLEMATLRERMAAVANWVVLKPKGIDQVQVVPAHPPDWSVKAVHKRGSYANIRPIEGVIEAPTMRPDGSILLTPGYDSATRLYLRPNVDIGTICERPSRTEAEQALLTLYDIVTDFPFKNEDHKAAWLSSLITAVARASFNGPAPLFGFDGNVPGSGKSKLADADAVIASGRRMPRSIWPSGRHADEEVRKRITAMALAGEQFTLLDNIDSDLGGGPLDAALTADTWKDRQLGTMQSTPALPMKIVWFASGNNLQYRGDFLRRVLPCRLESPLEDPENRTGFKHADLLGHVLENRGRLLNAVLTILLAHRAAGRPKMVEPLGSFEGWTRAVIDPVMWITGKNPLSVRVEVKAADRGAQCRGALVEGWAELPGSNTDSGLTVGAALKLVRDDKTELFYPVFRAALTELGDKGDLPSAKSVGRYLRSMQGRKIGTHVLKRVDVSSKLVAWKVETTAKP
jgi:hypothetical protein